ncbi:MAG: lipid asymmetry maintenance protein MlaB [Candidatus Tectimicrobiota bacterium]
MTHVMDTVHSPEAAPEALPEHTLICGAAELDIAGAHDFYGRLLAALQAEQPVVFDMAHVERVDTAIMQLLCAFVRDAQHLGLPVHWQHASPTFRHAARLLDVAACLALPGAAQPEGRSTTATFEKQ